jgi:hypothetical protein
MSYWETAFLIKLPQTKSPTHQKGEFEGFPPARGVRRFELEALRHKSYSVKSGRIDDLTNGYSNFEI